MMHFGVYFLHQLSQLFGQLIGVLISMCVMAVAVIVLLILILACVYLRGTIRRVRAWALGDFEVLN